MFFFFPQNYPISPNFRILEIWDYFKQTGFFE